MQVVAPQPRSPADKAGIQPQDALIAVDGKQVQGLSIYEAANLLQGESGSSVTLTLRSKGKQQTKDVQLTRCARKHPRMCRSVLEARSDG